MRVNENAIKLFINSSKIIHGGIQVKSVKKEFEICMKIWSGTNIIERNSVNKKKYIHKKRTVLKEITIVLSIDSETEETLDPLREFAVLSSSILNLRRTSFGTDTTRFQLCHR